MAKHNRKPRKVKVLKVEQVEPDKHIVELEVEGAPAIPETPPPVESLTFDEPQLPPEKKSWVKWLKDLF